MAGGAVADTVATTAGDFAGPIERFGHVDEIPLPATGFVDRVFPELRGQALGEVAAESIDTDVRLAFRRAGSVAGFFEPKDWVVGEVVPDLAGRIRVASKLIAFKQEGELVGVVGIRFVGILGAFFFHEGVVVAEVEFTHIGPVAEVVSIRSGGDLRSVACRQGGETLLGIPTGIEVGDFLGPVSRSGDAQIHRSLAQHDIGSAVVECAIHHHAHSPLVETSHEGLEFRKCLRLGIVAAEHGSDRPIIAHGIGAAGIKRLTGFGVRVATLDADRMGWLEPEHIDAHCLVVALV